MHEQPLPSSLDEVEHLILSLYQPNPPDVIASTQATLSRLQASSEAWSLARHLLGRPDEKVKFFGALTIIVKLNTESSSLNHQDATELLASLVGWYLDALHQGTGPLVLRKLSSALSTFFLHLHRLWPHFLRHLILCLAAGHVLPLQAAEGATASPVDEANLELHNLQAALWVITNVVEDVSKFDLNVSSNAGLYDAVVSNVPHAVALMARGLSMSTASSQAVENSIKCLQAWSWFAQRTSARDSQVVESLRPLITIIIDSLTQDATFEASLEFLSESLTGYSNLLTDQHYDTLSNLISSPWAQTRYQRLVEGDFDFESTQFGEFLLAFGDARVHVLMKSNDERSQNILTILGGLLAAKGYPVVEDRIFSPAIEFWSTYAETMTDYTFSEDEASQSWTGNAVSHLLRAISHAWQKIVYPPFQELADWDSSDRVGFSDARKDLVDLLQCTFTVAGPQLVFIFAELVIASLASSSWPQLEAAAFCLGGLADCTSADGRCDEALASVFNSSLFSRLQDADARSAPRVRQTCVSLIEQYTEYFEQNTSLLSSALTLLFKEVGEQSMSGPASKSILRLCSSCRHHLYPDVDSFLNEYQRLMSSRELDCQTSERILGAISSITQAMQDVHKRHDATLKLLNMIRQDVQRSLELAQTHTEAAVLCPAGSRCLDDAPDGHASVHLGLRSLRCLSSLAKGFKTPSDAPIDLDSDESSRSGSADPELRQLQQLVISIILDIQGAFSGNSEVTEQICSVLRSGFSEADPGPFVLPLPDVAQYITRHTSETPRIGLLVSTATSLINSLQSRSLSSQYDVLTSLLVWAIGLLQKLSEPGADPEVTQNGIEFVTRLLSKQPAIVLLLKPSDAVEFFLLFTLRVLDGHEPLAKNAAADFWTAFISLRDEDPVLQGAPGQAMNTLGPLLCESLARNMGGNASRSELEKLSEPLKKLVNRYPATKTWLEAGLAHPSFPSGKVTAEQKSFFVKKLISLRGTRATSQVVREFWLAARGSSFAYAS